MMLKSRMAVLMTVAVLMVGGGTAATFATGGHHFGGGHAHHWEYKKEWILKTCEYLKTHHYVLWKLLCKHIRW